jgi:outer membrane protein OmpA-like peptidoglycan-associated protein
MRSRRRRTLIFSFAVSLALTGSLVSAQAPTSSGLVVTLDDPYFMTGNQLRPEGADRLASVIRALRDDPNRRVLVEGYVDVSGSQVADQQLALQRASAVRDHLVRRGIPAARVVARGIGGSSPRVPASGAAARAPASGAAAPRVIRRVRVVVTSGAK